MTDILKKPLVAVVLAAAMVLGTTVLNTNVRLGKEVKAVENGFYSGVTYDGYAHKSISSQLENYLGAANGLATIANAVGIDSSALLEHCNTMKKVMKSGDISDIGNAYSDLVFSTNSMINELASAGLQDRNAQGFESYTGIISGAMGVIENSGYNESVREFCIENQVFPTDFLAALAGVEMPDLF